PQNAAGMTLVAAFQYDGGSVGDSNLTQVTVRPGGDEPDRVTQNSFDWRGRLVATKAGVQATEATDVHRPIVYSTYDNLGEVTSVRSYDGDGVTVTTSGGVPVAPESSLLR